MLYVKDDNVCVRATVNRNMPHGVVTQQPVEMLLVSHSYDQRCVNGDTRNSLKELGDRHRMTIRVLEGELI